MSNLMRPSLRALWTSDAAHTAGTKYLLSDVTYPSYIAFSDCVIKPTDRQTYKHTAYWGVTSLTFWGHVTSSVT